MEKREWAIKGISDFINEHGRDIEEKQQMHEALSVLEGSPL